MLSPEIKELEEILIGLMRELGVSKVDAMIALALIKAHHLQEDMILWVATFQGREEELTARGFMLYLYSLTDTV